jgi:acyl-CoA reductase-like NAD-dependent aldehyde dehydrogenase
MSDEDLKHLMNAREALVQKRLTCAQAIAANDTSDNAIRSIVEVQRAIEVVDYAIEELEQAELDEELAEDDEDHD